MSSFTFDLRDAFRGLRRDRAYAATVILTLALTIGATTAIFSIVNGVLLKPLAYRESHRLVAVREVWKQFPGTLEVNEQHFEYWQQHARSFESMAQYIALPANLTGAGEAAQIRLVHATGSLFDVVDTAFAARRYQMRLFVTFGVVALLIAVIGIYAVTAYGVSRRRREMNIRIAIGATASHVWRLILRDATVPLAVGVAAGAVGAVAAGSVVATLLFGVQARDPVVIAGVVGLVATVGVTASLLAARQGLSIDPAAALRDE